MIITVLTPTYNRGYIIEKLYESLLNQTNKKMEWIVVDDGSIDNTKQIFQKILAEKKIDIKYIEKENGGKHTAINEGVKLARGKIVIIVDSDDYLVENAIERIRHEGKKILDNQEFSGISFRRIRISDKKIIGNNLLKDVFLDTNSVDYRYKYKVTGDLAECFKLEVLKEFKFPIYIGEKFVPEALVWNRIAKKYKMRFFNNEGIYMCDYLPDGYSQQFNKLRKMNPQAYKNYYLEEFKTNNITLTRKIKVFFRILELRLRCKFKN